MSLSIWKCPASTVYGAFTLVGRSVLKLRILSVGVGLKSVYWLLSSAMADAAAKSAKAATDIVDKTAARNIPTSYCSQFKFIRTAYEDVRLCLDLGQRYSHAIHMMRKEAASRFPTH